MDLSSLIILYDEPYKILQQYVSMMNSLVAMHRLFAMISTISVAHLLVEILYLQLLQLLEHFEILLLIAMHSLSNLILVSYVLRLQDSSQKNKKYSEKSEYFLCIVSLVHTDSFHLFFTHRYI